MGGKVRPQVSQIQGPGPERIFRIFVLDLVQDFPRFQRKGRDDFSEIGLPLAGAGDPNVHGGHPHRLSGGHLDAENVPAALLLQRRRNLGVVVPKSAQGLPDLFRSLPLQEIQQGLVHRPIADDSRGKGESGLGVLQGVPLQTLDDHLDRVRRGGRGGESEEKEKEKGNIPAPRNFMPQSPPIHLQKLEDLRRSCGEIRYINFNLFDGGSVAFSGEEGGRAGRNQKAKGKNQRAKVGRQGKAPNPK